jgi:predicted RNase H-like HicB family nuclease
MFREYLAAAMKRARYEILSDDGTYYGEIPGFQGVLANAPDLEECRNTLEEVLEEWLLFSLSRGLPIPVVDGLDLQFKEPVKD